MRKSNLFSWWIFYSFEEKRGKTQFCPVEYRRKMQKKSHKKNIWKRDNFFTKTTRLGCIISYNRNKVKVLVKCDSLSGFLWSRTDCEKMSMILEVERDRSMAICFGATQHEKRAFVVTSTQNHRINILFNIIEILNKFKNFKNHWIWKFSNNIDLRKLDFIRWFLFNVAI